MGKPVRENLQQGQELNIVPHAFISQIYNANTKKFGLTMDQVGTMAAWPMIGCYKVLFFLCFALMSHSFLLLSNGAKNHYNENGTPFSPNS